MAPKQLDKPSLIQLIIMVNKMIINWRLEKLITSTSCKEGKVQILIRERAGKATAQTNLALFVPLGLVTSENN